jgi:hypothetical protein
MVGSLLYACATSKRTAKNAAEGGKVRLVPSGRAPLGRNYTLASLSGVLDSVNSKGTCPALAALAGGSPLNNMFERSLAVLPFLSENNAGCP